MEKLPAEVCLHIFCWLDHQNLATAQQVCKKWKALASDNILWSNLFRERWGHDRTVFYAPADSQLWKNVYEVQDRCDRVGLGLKIIREGGDYYLVHQGEIQHYLGNTISKGLKIIREGGDYYLVHQGEIQRYLGSRRQRKGVTSHLLLDSEANGSQDDSPTEEGTHKGILDRILFFVGDLEVASSDAKRGRSL